jgi:short-subunit dehydrogenase
MPYPISKMALEGYTKVLRQELKFQGIDVIVVRPGAIRTGLLEKVISLKSAVMSLRAKRSNGSIVFARNVTARNEVTKQSEPAKQEARQWHLAVQLQDQQQFATKDWSITSLQSG